MAARSLLRGYDKIDIFWWVHQGIHGMNMTSAESQEHAKQLDAADQLRKLVPRVTCEKSNITGSRNGPGKGKHRESVQVRIAIRVVVRFHLKLVISFMRSCTRQLKQEIVAFVC